MNHATRLTAARPMLLTLLFSAGLTAIGQTVTPVPKLDLDRTMGTWYELARFPVKREKPCVSDELVLYARGDKRNSFQIVTSCRIKDNDNTDSWNANGRMPNSGDGALKVRTIWPFSAKYW